MPFLQGCGTALVTPFHKDGSLDEATLRSLVKRQVDEGIDFLVPCGTTGESPTLTRAEHLRVVEIAVEEAKGRPVIAGAGGYNTHEVIELAKEVRAVGANGILSVTPYYNKPTQEGIYQHFKAIASAVKLPVILYNIQGRTGVNIETATLRRLSEVEYIAGVKEASGNINQISAVIHQLGNRDFAILSGDDAVTLPLIALGGHGVICTVSNEIPKEMTELTARALAGDFARAREIHHKFLPLMEANGIETNPIPVKAGMALMGLLEPIWRLPMCPPSDTNLAKIEKVLETLGLLAGRSVHAG